MESTTIVNAPMDMDTLILRHFLILVVVVVVVVAVVVVGISSLT